MVKMPELKVKSWRGDFETTAADYDQIDRWVPDRTIKIKRIAVSLDGLENQATMWFWLSKGAVGLPTSITPPIVEEMVIAALHVRGGDATETKSPDTNQFFDFGSDYIEVEEGEGIYLMTRGPVNQIWGYCALLYYL